MTQDNSELLDETLDDLADLPQSAPFPNGAHVATMFPSRNAKSPGSYVFKFKYKQTEELTDPNAALPAVNDEAVVFITTKKKDGTPNPFGQGQLKELMKPLGVLFNSNSVGEIIEQAKAGVDVMIVTAISKSKDPQYPDKMIVKKIDVI